MSEISWQEIETIIDQALDLPEKKRKEFVHSRCEGKPQLKGEVTQLLKSIFDSQGWLEDPADYKWDLYDEMGEDVQLLSAAQSLEGTKVGSHIIKEKIGQGGMSLVYLAEHSEPDICHKVAIKIIRSEKATQENIKRFEREQQILAKLHHPGIAQLFDAGTTGDGYPYIIMEYVDGIPLTDYCWQNSCTLDQKLGLFSNVLQAVQYAHENLVIHRDLKPGNILVDASGAIKILDFGISKLLEDDDNSLTKTGARLLTPRYAAPEQVRQENITTATDLYALGIIFYQLLSDMHPFNFDELSRYEIEKKILNEEAAKPSSKVSDAKDKKSLQGDLDAIALKAIRKEPEHRYRVANEFLKDLNNYYKEKPVSAREDSFRYRSQKFFKRHKKPVAIATGVFLVIVGLTGFYTWRIAQERDEARLQAQRAEQQAERAEQVSAFMTNLFKSNYPKNTSGKDIPVSTVIEAGIESLNEQDLSSGNRATILALIAEVQIKLSKNESAQKLSREALDLVMDSVETFNLNIVEVPIIHGSVASISGDFKTAEESFKIADSLFHEYNFTDTYEYRVLKFNLTDLYNEQARYREALETLESLNPETFGEDEEAIIEKSNFYNYKGIALKNLGKPKDALSFYTKALEYRIQVYGHNNSEVGTMYNNISGLYISLKQYEKAKKYAKQAYNIRRETLGPNHTLTATPIWTLSIINRRLGLNEEALKDAEKAAEILKSSLGPSHWRYAITIRGEAEVLINMNRFKEAKKKIDEATEIINTHYPSNAVFKAHFNATYPNLYKGLNNLDKAAEYYSKSISFFKEGMGETHPKVAEILLSCAKMEMGRENYNKAHSLLKEAFQIQKHNEQSDEELEATKKLIAECKKKANYSATESTD